MAELNPNIILGVQPLNYLQTVGNAVKTADAMNTVSRQNALADLYSTDGAGIANGDQNALNKLAALDPMAAMGVTKDRLSMDATRADIANSAARLGMEGQRLRIMNAQESRAAAEYAAGLDDTARKQQADQMESYAKAGMVFLQNNDKPGYENWVRAQGGDPTQYPYESIKANAAKFMDWSDIMRGGKGGTEYGLNPVYGRDQQGNVVVMQVGKDGSAVATKMPEGVTADLGVKSQEAARGSAVGKATGEAQGAAVTGIQAATDSANQALAVIDRISSDPGLDGYVGNFQGRLPDVTQGAADFTANVENLGGKIYMQAYQQLRGAGAITEQEGQAAAKAIQNLSVRQSPEQFRQNLDDLRGIIQRGVERLQSQASGNFSPSAGPSDDDLLKKYGG